MHVNPWLIHVNVRQKPLQYCKVISLQLIKIIGEKKYMSQKKNKIINYSPQLTVNEKSIRSLKYTKVKISRFNKEINKYLLSAVCG